MKIKSLTLFGLIPFLFGCNASLSKEIIMPNSKECKSREQCPCLFVHMRCVRVQNTLFETKVIGSHIHSFYDPDLENVTISRSIFTLDKNNNETLVESNDLFVIQDFWSEKYDFNKQFDYPDYYDDSFEVSEGSFLIQYHFKEYTPEKGSSPSIFDSALYLRCSRGTCTAYTPYEWYKRK